MPPGYTFSPALGFFLSDDRMELRRQEIVLMDEYDPRGEG
jgi:hypothetical protein